MAISYLNHIKNSALVFYDLYILYQVLTCIVCYIPCRYTVCVSVSPYRHGAGNAHKKFVCHTTGIAIQAKQSTTHDGSIARATILLSIHNSTCTYLSVVTTYSRNDIPPYRGTRYIYIYIYIYIYNTYICIIYMYN